MDKKLYRDPQNGMIAGVYAGVAEYFGWDPTWVRLGWALFTLLGGSGLILVSDRGDHHAAAGPYVIRAPVKAGVCK
ncbi:MAG: PspC domain-containing protein [Dysosmobacter sp.]